MTEPEKTITFVIGAGASREVRMPTGYELKSAISSVLNFKKDTFNRVIGGGSIFDAMYQLGQEPKSLFGVDKYFRAASLIANAMPQTPSIDNFINSHKSDLTVAHCGKLAIADQILKAERSSLLYVDRSNRRNKLNFQQVEDTWFNAFFHLITVDTQLEEIPLRLARFKIITFNYDRTLEHFLHCSIQNFYGCSNDAATEALKGLVVLHPYGSVGGLPWQKPDGYSVEFGDDLQSSTLTKVALGLRTFTEGTDPSSSQIIQIRRAIADADTLVFLGFAYHPLNMELLFGEGFGGTKMTSKPVFGTAMAISESNRKAIAHQLSKLGGYDTRNISLGEKLTAAELFREYSRSLSL